MYTVAHGDEWVLAGYHGAGRRPPNEKIDAGMKHAVNEALRARPDVIIFGQGEDEETHVALSQGAAGCHAAGFRVLRAAGRGVDGIYTFCGDLPDDEKVHVIGQTALLGQLRQLGCEADGESLEISALRTMHGVGPKTAQAILDEGDPFELMQRAAWLPKCRGAEKIRAALTPTAYNAALEQLRLKRVALAEEQGERGAEALRKLGLGLLADRIEESEYAPDAG